MGLRNISLPQIYAIEFYGAHFATESDNPVLKLGATELGNSVPPGLA
jgi:hypothetical protein